MLLLLPWLQPQDTYGVHDAPDGSQDFHLAVGVMQRQSNLHKFEHDVILGQVTLVLLDS